MDPNILEHMYTQENKKDRRSVAQLKKRGEGIFRTALVAGRMLGR